MLKNPKWEAFTQALARGVPQVRAYAEAGFKPSAPNASNLAKRPEIAARVEEIRAQLEALHEEANARANDLFIAQTQLDQAAILGRLQRIAEVCDGTRLIKETVADHTGKTREVEVSHLDMSQARQAWESIGRQAFGMFHPRTRADVNLTGAGALDSGTKAKIAALVRDEIPAADNDADAIADAQARPGPLH